MNNFYKVMVLLLAIGIGACTNKKEKLSKAIYDLEVSDSSSNTRGMNKLADMYFDYSKQFTKDSISERFLYKAFMFKYITKNWDKAIEMANFYKSSYPNTENTANINLKLADLYYSGKNNQDSAVYYYLLAEGKAQFSTDEKRNAAFILEQWSYKNLQNPQTPRTLYTSGKLYQLVTEYLKAVTAYEAVAKNFPDYEKRPDALLAAGFICWDNLKEPEKAKYFYKLLVEKYPNHPLSKDAKTALDENMIGMSDLELSEYLMKKNKDNSKAR